MQSENRFLDDFAKMVNGVAGTVAGMGREAKENLRERNREWMAGLDLVTREEFDAIKELAAKARAEADALAKRVEKLEAALAGKAKAATPISAPAKAATTPAAAKKPAVRKRPSAKK
jgi:BMFP domain-containing protein YqiC